MSRSELILHPVTNPERPNTLNVPTCGGLAQFRFEQVKNLDGTPVRAFKVFF